MLRQYLKPLGISILHSLPPSSLHFSSLQSGQQGKSGRSQEETKIDWREADKKELNQLTINRYYKVKHFIKQENKWKKPLEKKRLSKERKRLRDAQREPPVPQTEQFVVHNPQIGVELPPNPEELFAVVKIGGFQHKVTQHCKIINDYMPYKVGDQLALPSVMLIGTPGYTSIGRPFLNTARVIVTVEEQTLSNKIIIFKKKRRKGYQKNMSHRQKLTVLRVDAIEHSPGEEILKEFKNLS